MTLRGPSTPSDAMGVAITSSVAGVGTRRRARASERPGRSVVENARERGRFGRSSRRCARIESESESSRFDSIRLGRCRRDDGDDDASRAGGTRNGCPFTVVDDDVVEGRGTRWARATSARVARRRVPRRRARRRSHATALRVDRAV